MVGRRMCTGTEGGRCGSDRVRGAGRGAFHQPRAGVRTSEYGRDYRIGYGMQVLEQGRLNLQLGIDGERRESPIFHVQEQSGRTDQRVLGRATVQW